MSIPSEDFDEYAIAEPGREFVFGVREFRAMLQFCAGDSSGSATMLFREPGLPLMLTTDADGTAAAFSAELVIATLLPEDPTNRSNALLSQSTNISSQSTTLSSIAA